MLGSVLGIGSGLVWAVAVFNSGKASRTVSAPLITALYNAFAFIFFLVAVFVSDEINTLTNAPGDPLRDVVLSGILGGFGFSLGLVFISQGLSKGRTGVIAPITAMLCVIFPFIHAAITENLPSSFAIAGIAILLPVPWLVSRTNNVAAHISTSISRDVGFGLATGASFGTYFISLIITPANGQMLMLAVTQLVGGAVMITAHIISKRSWSLPKDSWRHVLTFLVFELCGIIFLRMGLNRASSAVVATLSAIFDPAGLLILARIFNNEKFSRLQILGFIITGVGIALVIPNS